MADYTKLHERYMQLQGIPLYKMTVAQRHELQGILTELIGHKQSSSHDITNYYWPRFSRYDADIRDIKHNIEMEIAMQRAKIITCEQNIKKFEEMLKGGTSNVD